MSNYFNDRVVEYPGRVTLTPTGQSDTYDMARAEGTVTEPGSPFNAEIFNGAIDLYAMWYGTCSTTANSSTKIVTCPGFELVTGATIAVKFDNASTYTGATHLNVNSAGIHRIRTESDGSAAVNNLWAPGAVVIFIYDGSSWIIQDIGVPGSTLAAIMTTLGLSATSSGTRLGDILKSLADRTAANKQSGSRVTLDSYTSTDYTFPSDGYLFCTCGANQNAQASVALKDANGTYLSEMGGLNSGTWATWVLYVTKGMRCRVTVANDGHVYFSPMGV